jgi:hypothetical protein
MKGEVLNTSIKRGDTSMTKGEAAGDVYDGKCEWDCALPIHISKHMYAHGFDIRGDFVWIYPKTEIHTKFGKFSPSSICGQLGPITEAGMKMMNDKKFMEAYNA